MSTLSLAKLVDNNNSAWSLIQQWVVTASNSVTVLPVNKQQAEEALFQLQVTTRSPMGAVAFETGGILVDHGWLRFLGSGNTQMMSNLLSFNGLKQTFNISHIKGAFVVAYDAVGGFFAINGGALPGPNKNIFYLAPDTLQWEDLEQSYSELLYWALFGDLNQFYQNARWDDWQAEIADISGDQAISIYPPLWAMGPSVDKRSRKAVPIHELWMINIQGVSGEYTG